MVSWRFGGRRPARVAAVAVALVAVLAAGAATAAAAGVIRPAAAGTGAGGRMPVAGPGLGYGWQALGLSDEQIKQIDEIRRQALADAQPVQSQLSAKRQELASEYTKDVPDPARVQSLVREIAGLRGEIAAIQAGARARVLAVLTEEQRARLRTFGRFGPGVGRAGALCPGQGFGGRHWGHFGPRGGMMGPGWSF